MAAIEVCVKAAAGDPDILGDCPFSHRIFLILEEKKVPYKLKLINTSDKRSWFLEISPEGKVPVLKSDKSKWVPDSDVITQLIEDIFPEPSLVTPSEYASVGSKIFPSFVKFLKSKDPEDGSEKTLLEELSSLDQHLKDHGPYIAGENISGADLALAPKLFHLEIFLAHFKLQRLECPRKLDSSSCLHKVAFQSGILPEDQACKGLQDHVIAGWAPKVDA